MRKLLKLSPAALLGIMLSGASYGADVTYNFDDSSQTNAFTILGTQAGVCWSDTNGNPETGGFLQMLNAVDSENCVIIFPDLDGFPIKAFHFTVDVRVGNDGGDLNARAADGFSISLCREGDPITYWASQTPPVARGAAGGDSAAQALESAAVPASCDAGNFENGTKTGVAIVFDAWQGNHILDINGNDAPDVEGIAVRVDDRTLTQIDMSGFRNGNCYDGGDPTVPCASTVCTNWQSMATGPSDAVNFDPVAGTAQVAGTGEFTNLCWAPLDVELTADSKVTVIWKGHTMLDHFQLANYAPHRGRLIFMGRTGGNNQNVHFDNLHLVTTPATEPLFTPPTATSFGFRFGIDDNGPSVVTNVSSVILDGTEVRPQTVVTKSGITTTGVYSQATPFVSGSTHTVSVTYKTSLGQTLSPGSFNFTMPVYSAVLPTLAVPTGSIDVQSNGFNIKPYETLAANPTRNYWSDEALFGFHGTNLIDFTALFNVINGDTVVLDGHLAGETLPMVNFANATGSQGQFINDLGFSYFGVTTDDPTNTTLAINHYLYFPAAGLYTLGVNSDDGFRLTLAANSADVLGQQILSFDGGRGIGLNQNTVTLFIAQPGYYGARLMWYNGGGGAGLEYYTTQTPATNETVLINDPSSPTSVKTYRDSSAAPAYYSMAEPPLQDDAVNPDQALKWEITDAATTVVGNPTVKLDGVSLTPTVTHPSPGVTHFEVAPSPYWVSGNHTLELGFTDSLGTNRVTTYVFSTIPQLSTNLWSAPGSGVNQGLRMSIFQSPNTNIINGWKNLTQMANQAVEGFMSPNNIANLGSFTHNGQFWETSIINYSETSGVPDQNGNFQSNSVPSRPDRPIPGIPGTTGSGDNCAFVVNAFVEFPAAGTYVMGVNSDDGFRVTQGDRPAPGRSIVSILAPQSLAGDVPAVDQHWNDDGTVNFGSLLPATPLIRRAVLCDPPWPTAMPDNAAALAGNIAIVHRTPAGGVAAHSYWAQQAGAVGVLVVDQDDVGPTRTPGVWGVGSPTPHDVPIVMIGYNAGTNLIAHATTGTDSPAMVMISDETSTKLGEFSQGRGSSDTIFRVFVPQAGLYPLRLLWENGGGGENCEWFTVLTDGTKLPLNDPDPNALKVWIGRTSAPPAHMNTPVVSPGAVTVSWTGAGMLEWALSASGPWFEAPNYGNPSTLPTLGTTAYFRVRSY